MLFILHQVTAAQYITSSLLVNLLTPSACGVRDRPNADAMSAIGPKSKIMKY